MADRANSQGDGTTQLSIQLENLMINTDVLIIGGGPAGAACAWRLRQNHIDCILVDQVTFPRLKLCAGWITPKVLEALQIKPDDCPFGLMTFTSFNMSIKGIKIPFPTHQYAIRRMEFDTWLLKRSGVTFALHQVKEITKENDRYIIDGIYSAKFLVGAGGTNCPVYQSIFKPHFCRLKDTMIVALEEEFLYPFTDKHCYLWFFENSLPGYSWYVPKRGGYVNVGIGAKITKLKANHDTIKHQWEFFVAKLEKRRLIQDHVFHPRGYAYYLRQKTATNRVGNAFLVGDALGLATLDMGEGIGPAIQSGLLAAHAIIHEGEYSLQSIAKYSIPSLLRIHH